MSGTGRVSRAPRELSAARNCTRDEGGPFEFGDQEPISSHRKLLRATAVVVSVAETPGQDFGRHGRERRAQGNRTVPARRALSLSYGDGEFESRSLQRRVSCEPGFLRQGAENFYPAACGSALASSSSSCNSSWSMRRSRHRRPAPASGGPDRLADAHRRRRGSATGRP